MGPLRSMGPSSHPGMRGTHTASARPRGPGWPSSPRSVPSCHQDPESTRRPCSGRCLRHLPGRPPPPYGTARHPPCPAAALQQPAAQHRVLRPPQPGRAAVPPLPAESLSLLVPPAQLSQRTLPGVCASACSSSPSSPVPVPAPRARSGEGVKLQPAGLGALGVWQTPAAYLAELGRKAGMREGREPVPAACVTAYVQPAALHRL